MSGMTYEEALTFLNAPKYSKTRPGLGPVTELLRRLGNPQDGRRYVHITGTNGKGSTAAYIASALQAAGFRTGLYTSPFLEKFTERIRVNGEEIPEEDVARLTVRVKAASDAMLRDGLMEPTVFELVTAAAFLYFRERACDIVVLEVGMGGRLDATNVIQSAEISVITPIAYDHMEFLGDTLAEIAYEKAGIIKEDGLLAAAPQEPEAAGVLRMVCTARRARLRYCQYGEIEMVSTGLSGQRFRYHGKEIRIRNAGLYQIRNAALAYDALSALREKWGGPVPLPDGRTAELTEEAIFAGLAEAGWAGRFEVLSEDPPVVIDGAHNPNGTEAFVESLRALLPERKLTFIVGVLADKDYPAMLRITRPLAARYLTVTPESPRALPAEDLAGFLRAEGAVAEAYPTIAAAVDEALASGGPVAAFGSLYYIGALRTYLRPILEEARSN